jgi:hypothetical protein
MQISKITFYNKSKRLISKATAILLKVLKLYAQSSHFHLIFCAIIIYIIHKVSVHTKHMNIHWSQNFFIIKNCEKNSTNHEVIDFFLFHLSWSFNKYWNEILENSILLKSSTQSFNYSIRFGFISWSKTYLTIKYWFERKCFKTRDIELHTKYFFKSKKMRFLFEFF